MRPAPVLALILLALIGCNGIDRYELTTTQSGRTYRINRMTGDVSLVEGYTITTLREPDSYQDDALAQKRISEPFVWNPLSLPVSAKKQVRLTLKTFWREGSLYYQLEASPYDGPIKDAAETFLSSSKYFNLKLIDSYGFKLISIHVPLSSMTGVVDNSGKRTHMSMNESVPCNLETYLALSSWNSSWSL